jgi:hypothetical protein
MFPAQLHARIRHNTRTLWSLPHFLSHLPPPVPIPLKYSLPLLHPRIIFLRHNKTKIKTERRVKCSPLEAAYKIVCAINKSGYNLPQRHSGAWVGADIQNRGKAGMRPIYHHTQRWVTAPWASWQSGIWRMPSSGMWRLAGVVRTNLYLQGRKNQLRTTLAVTSKLNHTWKKHWQ